MNIRNVYRKVRRALYVNRFALWAENGLARLVVRGGPRQATVLPKRHLVVAAPGGGSIGDQAMLEAYVATVEGAVEIVTQDPDTLVRTPPGRAVEVTQYSNLLYGSPLGHLRDLVAFQASLRHARSVSVVGADVMDGVYNVASSVRRFRLLELAAARGVDARALGFSWNAAPHAAAKRAMQACGEGVTLNARDPRSAERLRRDGASNVVDVADLAFLAPQLEEELGETQEWLTQQKSAGRKIVLINANALLEKHMDQAKIYGRLGGELVRAGWSVLYVPHDSRRVPSDVDLAWSAARAVPRDSLGGESPFVHVAAGVTTPSEVISLAKSAEFAITGRMHLAVLSAVAETPAIALSYQGKVEGLYERLGSPFVVEPGEGAEGRLRDQMLTLMTHAETYRGKLQECRETLRALAARNVTDLGERRVA